MASRHLVGALFVSIPTALGAFALAACEGAAAQEASAFVDPPDASEAATPEYDSGTLFHEDAAPKDDATSGDGGTCAPEALPPSFTATWHVPNAFGTGACTPAQIDQFYTACLTPPIDSMTCGAFVAANGVCSTCLESTDKDAKYGPVIWHSNRTYFTLNIAGCIANAQADTSAKSCGAAYQAVLECKQTACEGCFLTGGGFSAFSACQTAAGKAVCKAYGDAMSDTCGKDLRDAGSPSSVCLPPSGTSTKEAYKRIAPLFCGN
jgi:hypothetical protein